MQVMHKSYCYVFISGYDIFFDDLNYQQRPYNAGEAYSQSKLANVLFSRELANKLKVMYIYL